VKRLLLFLLLVIAPVGVMAATSAAAGGVSIEQGNPWNGFQPDPAQPGGTVNVTVTTFQDQNVGANATVTFTGLTAAGLREQR
jgi:hypothetical protein